MEGGRKEEMRRKRKDFVVRLLRLAVLHICMPALASGSELFIQKVNSDATHDEADVSCMRPLSLFELFRFDSTPI